MNLLPKENKIAYKKFYLKRLFFVFGSLVFFVMVSGVILSAPGLWLMLSHKKELLSEVEFLSKKDLSLTDSLIATEIKKLNDRAREVENAMKKKKYPSLIFKSIIDKKNKGIKITFLSYEKEAGSRDAKKEDKILFGGIAEKRDDLILFEMELKKDFGEDNVVSPVSNLINGKNLDFSISLYVKNEK